MHLNEYSSKQKSTPPMSSKFQQLKNSRNYLYNPFLRSTERDPKRGLPSGITSFADYQHDITGLRKLKKQQKFQSYKQSIDYQNSVHGLGGGSNSVTNSNNNPRSIRSLYSTIDFFQVPQMPKINQTRINEYQLEQQQQRYKSPGINSFSLKLQKHQDIDKYQQIIKDEEYLNSLCEVEEDDPELTAREVQLTTNDILLDNSSFGNQLIKQKLNQNQDLPTQSNSRQNKNAEMHSTLFGFSSPFKQPYIGVRHSGNNINLKKHLLNQQVQINNGGLHHKSRSQFNTTRISLFDENINSNNGNNSNQISVQKENNEVDAKAKVELQMAESFRKIQKIKVKGNEDKYRQIYKSFFTTLVDQSESTTNYNQQYQRNNSMRTTAKKQSKKFTNEQRHLLQESMELSPITKVRNSQSLVKAKPFTNQISVDERADQKKRKIQHQKERMKSRVQQIISQIDQEYQLDDASEEAKPRKQVSTDERILNGQDSSQISSNAIKSNNKFNVDRLMQDRGGDGDTIIRTRSQFENEKKTFEQVIIENEYYKKFASDHQRFLNKAIDQAQQKTNVAFKDDLKNLLEQQSPMRQAQRAQQENLDNIRKQRQKLQKLIDSQRQDGCLVPLHESFRMMTELKGQPNKQQLSKIKKHRMEKYSHWLSFAKPKELKMAGAKQEAKV